MTCRPVVGLSIALLALATPRAYAQVSEPETRRFFSCRTIVTFSAGQGTQVSYLSPTGKVYLWSPGNDTVLSGNWRIDPRASSGQSARTYVALCFQYETDTPAMGQTADQRECRPAEMMERATIDHADGDVFALAGRSAVPFRLPRDRANIATLQQRLRAQSPDVAQPMQRAAGCE